MCSSARTFTLMLTAALAAVCLASPASADIVLYSHTSSYNAATTGNTTVDFTGIAPTDYYIQESVPPGISVGGVSFTIDTAESNGNLYVIDAGFSNNFFHQTVLDSQFSSATNENLLITLPYPVTAVAFDFGSNNSSTITFDLSTGDSFTRSTTAQAIQFVGVTSTIPITSIKLSQPLSGALVLKDFTFGTAVPEPASLTLVSTSGLVLLGYGLRRRRLVNTKRAQG